MAIPSISWLARTLPCWWRRLVVLDPGSRYVKVLVVDAGPRALHVVHYQTLRGAESDPEQAERLAEELDQLLAEAGPHERVLVLPQYRTISAVVDLPADGTEERHTALVREARRLSGLEESALAWHAVSLRPFGRFSSPVWLTLCKQEELDHLIARLAPPPEGPGAEPPDLAEIVPSGQALLAAASELLGPDQHAVLVDLRARNSVVVLVVHGQGVSTATVPIGLDHLQAALGRSLSAAGSSVATGTASGGTSRTGPEEWAAGIRLAVSEWLEDHPEAGLSPADFRGLLAGPGAGDAELLGVLNRHVPPRFEPWQTRRDTGRPWPVADYLTCYGAALLALKRAPAGLSLLPAGARALHRRRRTLAGVLSANVLLLGLVLAALVAGFVQKRGLIERKRTLTRQSQAALQTALEIDRLYRELNLDYERVYPVLLRQRQTFETLQALTAVRDSRTNDAFWYVLFADAASYQQGTSSLTLAPLPVPPRTPTGPESLPGTNAPAPARPEREFIAELCIPLEGEALRRVLSDVVANLQQNVLFRRVDALPDERRQDLVDPRVAVSNRVFSLALEVAGRDLPPPRALAPRGKPAPERSGERAPRRPAGPSGAAP